MRSTIKQPPSLQSIDRRMILLLKREGAQTMDDLVSLAGVGWERVLFSVDRLSRTGKVSLSLVRPGEYRITFAGQVRESQVARPPGSAGRSAGGGT